MKRLHLRLMSGILISLLIATSCGDIEFRPESRHFEACSSCEMEYEGRTLELKAPHLREEKILDKLLELRGLSLRPFVLCRVKGLGETAGFATVKNGRMFTVIGDDAVSPVDALRPILSAWLVSHETGHHLMSHYIDNSEDSHTLELESDISGGYSLFLLGFTLEEAMSVKSPDTPATKTHPSGKDRIAAIERGWLKAQKQFEERVLAQGGEKPQNVEETENSSSLFSSVDDVRERIVISITNDMERVVSDFIIDLGYGDFAGAFALQKNPNWGPYLFFSSKAGFGGITETQLLKTPRRRKYITYQDGVCVDGIISAKYVAVDPYNDTCRDGFIYEQMFRVRMVGDEFKITDAKLKSRYCFQRNDRYGHAENMTQGQSRSSPNIFKN